MGSIRTPELFPHQLGTCFCIELGIDEKGGGKDGKDASYWDTEWLAEFANKKSSHHIPFR
jgi:hypothetical protein